MALTHTTPNRQAKRAVCMQCLRPQTTCICTLIVRTPHATDLLILQHPMEVHHAKNTARLLHLCLPGSRLVVGEVFDNAQLLTLVPHGNRAVLLYPLTPHTPGGSPQEAVDLACLGSASQITLVVLDATWRKSRKMLMQSPALQGLPRLPLPDNATPSGYAIRKAHQPHQLSTLEATCAALTHLEQNATQFAPVLKAFSGFVAQQQQLTSQRSKPS